MSTEEVFVQQFAKLFAHYRDALTLNHDSRMNTQAQEWNQIPTAERDRMVAAARLALMEIESTAVGETDRSRYFAKPGEAEWGC
jgi:hypothetical protein